jgi:hypothetical protein
VTDKPIVLSRHASDVVAERKLAVEWIAAVIQSPAFTEPDPTQLGALRAFGRIAAFGNRMLRWSIATLERNTASSRCFSIAERPGGHRSDEGANGRSS